MQRPGRLVSLNREANRILQSLGRPGQPWEQLLREGLTCRRADGRETLLDPFPLVAEPSNAETIRAEEIVLSMPDGRSVTTLVNATPIQAADGTVASLVVTIQDLTPLEELERMRAEFVAMVSHELRAPLTSIKGSAATALGASRVLDPAEVRQFFRIIDDQADHMDSLIGNLLDVGRIDAGTLSVAPEPTQVAALVDQARNTFLSGGARHPLLIDLPPDLPRVMADRERIVQVLNNLLSNAARHAPESSPIRVSATRDGMHVAVTVADEGTGLAPELLPQFRKYSRIGARDDERGVGGGLGLAICKGLVETHGGRIRAESAGVGRGTQVTFTIPVAEEAATRSPSLPPPAADEPDRILVVDDDPQTLRYVRDALADAGFKPVVTGDPGTARHRPRTEAPAPAARPVAARERRHRAYGIDARAGRSARHLHLRLRARPDHRACAAGRRRRLRRQAVLTDRARGPSPGGSAQPDRNARAVPAGRAGHRLRTPRSDVGRPSGTSDPHRVRAALPALAQRGTGCATYDLLLRGVWRRNVAEDSELVRTFVKRLRRKLGDDAARPAYIFTERGVGYRMPIPEGP